MMLLRGAHRVCTQSHEAGGVIGYTLTQLDKGLTNMRFRKTLLGLVAAIVIALAICLAWTPVSYSDRLVLLQAEQELGHIDQRILLEPVDVQSILLDYAPDSELVLKA